MKNFSAGTISRKALLGGTALVTVAAALTAVSVTGYAQSAPTTRQVNINSEWRSSASGALNNAAENDHIEIGANTNPQLLGVTVTITGNGTLPNAVNGTRTTEVGDITDITTATKFGNLTIRNSVSATNNLTANIKSVQLRGNMNAYAYAGAGQTNGKKLTVNVAETTNVGNLRIENFTSSTATTKGHVSAVEATLKGKATVTGTTDVIAGASSNTGSTSFSSGVTGATATLNLKGAVDAGFVDFNTFNGAVRITAGGVSSANNATINLHGNAKFNGGVALMDTSDGKAYLNIVGTTADQRIEGDIKGALNGVTGGVGNGTLTINNRGKIATFTGEIGSATSPNARLAMVRVGSANNNVNGANAVFEKNVSTNKFEIRAASVSSSASTRNSSATFKGDLNVAHTDGLKLIGNLSTNGQAIAIFNGTQAQTVNAKIAVQSNGKGVVKVQNTGGTVKFQQTIGAGNLRLGEMEIDSGATAEFAKDAYINIVKGGGTIRLSGNRSLVFKDSFGADGKAMTIYVVAGKSAYLLASSDKTAYTNITLGGVGATLHLGSSVSLHSGVVSVKGNVKTTLDGEGVLKIGGATNKTTKINGNIGADGKALKTLDLGNFRSEVIGNVYAKTIQFSTMAGTTRATFGGNVKAETSFKFSAPGHQATFNGTGPQTITGAITANTDGDGRILVSNTAGIVTFKSAIGKGGTAAQAKRLADVRLDAATQIVFDKALHTKRLNSLAKKITFNEAGSSVADNLILRPRSEITLGNGITNGKTVINLGRQTTSLKDANVKVNMPSSLKNGQSIKLLKGNGVTNARADSI